MGTILQYNLECPYCHQPTVIREIDTEETTDDCVICGYQEQANTETGERLVNPPHGVLTVSCNSGHTLTVRFATRPSDDDIQNLQALAQRGGDQINRLTRWTNDRLETVIDNP